MLAIALFAVAAFQTCSQQAVASALYVVNENAGDIAIFSSSGGNGTIFTTVGVNGPDAIAFDSAGNLYVANSSGNTIERYTPGGAASVFADSSSGLAEPFGLAFDSSGNLYVSNMASGAQYSILRFTPAGVVSVVADSSKGLSQPTGLAFDSAGNLYISNFGLGNIIKMTPSGVFSIFAAMGNNGLATPIGLAFDSAGNLYVANQSGGTNGTILRFTPSGVGSIFAASYLDEPQFLAFDSAGNLYASNYDSGEIAAFTPSGSGSYFARSSFPGNDGLAFAPVVHPAFFSGEVSLGGGVYYLAFPNGNIFGYYNYQFYPTLYHYDLGFEYVIDAMDGVGGVFFYDFASGHFWYTSPVFPFPYLYDFGLSAFLYYIPATNNPGHYTTNPRYFSNLTTGMIITQ